MPAKQAIAKLLARLPWRLKGSTLSRLTGHLLDVAPISRDVLFRTNMGLPLPGPIRIPAWAGPHALFGNPAAVDGEQSSVDVCLKLVELCDMFFDVGAHLGYYTWAIAEHVPSGLTVAVEPAPRLAQLLRDNASDLGWSHRIEVFEGAVGREPGRATFHFNEEQPSMSTLVAEFVERFQHVDCEVLVATLASLLEARDARQALLKVDVEAAEWDVLAGLVSQSTRVRFLVMEVLGPAVASGFLDRASAQLGMEYAHIEPDALVTRPPWGGDENARNWLFFREADRRVVSARLQFS